MSPLQGVISDKSFLGGYIHHNRNYIQNFTFSSFSSFGSALICQYPPIHSFRGWFQKNSFLVVIYIIIGTYIANFTFLASVVLALYWYVSNLHLSLQGMISEKFFLSVYIHHNRNLHCKFYISSFSSFVSVLICQQPPFHPLQGMISEKFFLSDYIHHNSNLYCKFYISRFSSLGSALICQSVSQSVSPFMYIDE